MNTEQSSNKSEKALNTADASAEIKVGDIVKYLPKNTASWIGVVTEIKNDEETKRHGHSGIVYIVHAPFSTVRIATRKENLIKFEFA